MTNINSYLDVLHQYTYHVLLFTESLHVPCTFLSHSSIDREDNNAKTTDIDSKPTTDVVTAHVSVYEELDTLRRHPVKKLSIETPHPENVDNISTDGSESSCVNEHGEPIYSKPDMSKKLNRSSTLTEIDCAASLSPSADSAIGECEEAPPSVPRKSDIFLE